MTLLAEYAFDEGSGLVVGDTSGNGHNLALPASPRAQWVTGKNGGGLSGGTAAYVVNDPTANGAYGDVLAWYPLTGSWTVAFWAKIPTADGRLLWDVSQGSGSNTQFGMMAINNVIWFLYPGGNQFISSSNWADNAWHHWAWAYDAAAKTSTLYADGALCPTTGWPPLSGTDMSATWTAAQLSIVGVPYSSTTSSGSANGTVDDFRVFDTALTQADVQTWMNTPAGGSSSSATYAVAGTAAGAAATHGSVAARLGVAGTAAATTGMTGVAARVPRAYVAAGVAAATTGSSGAVTAQRPVGGSVDVISATTGAPGRAAQSYPAAATAAATAAVHGSIAATLHTTGTVGARTTATGTVGILNGPATLPVSAVATARTDTTGTILLLGTLHGATTAASTTTGAPTLQARVSGPVNAVSHVAGAVTIASNLPARDIDMTAGPTYTDWKVMGVTQNPMSAGPVGNNDIYTAGATTGSDWAAAPITTSWTAGPIWIQE